MYAELHALTNFSFLRGASHPQEMVTRAAELGYCAIAITDECSVAGVVRAHEAARQHGIQLIVGSELRCSSGLTCVALATSRRGYASLSVLITRARRAAPKGGYLLQEADLAGALPDCLLIWLPAADSAIERTRGAWLHRHFEGRLWIGVERYLRGDHPWQALARLAAHLGLPLVACAGALMHDAARQPLHDTLTAIRLGKPLDQCGYELQPSAERHLRPLATLRRLYPPALLEQSVALAARCHFSLGELRYEYPREIVPDEETPASWLRTLTEQGARRHWPAGVPAKVRGLIEHELALIASLRYEPYFLTVYDLVREARQRGILCQGRGSAANSAVCFCLGITAVDPERQQVLFERFVSRERDEPPDIDVDFEHERREEIIQYIYGRYGRHRAGLAATVITYRRRSALRDVGKALGFDVAQVEQLIRALARRSGQDPDGLGGWLREAGFDPDSAPLQRLLARVRELIGFPRHLSQHVGGFVIAADLLESLVPIENAAMPERTVIQWDKDDLESLGLLKVDILALGALTAIRKALDLYNARCGTALTLATIPPEDAATYRMIQRADTIGVFQIESRAQMSMLPRLKPERFYDLVVEVAIVRPGPIQGGMVHPYLRRREGIEACEYPSVAVRGVLERTLGVPIFQEQVMQLAVVAAGFTPGEADQLRRAMAAWKRAGDLGAFRERLLNGLREHGYSEQFAERLYAQIHGFGEYGFPESHAASFALLAYATAWLKCHAPAEYTAALLNSQPMGFYAPAQLVRDARRHGVTIFPVCVNASDWDCTLEGVAAGTIGMRLGLRLVRGLSRAGAQSLVDARRTGAFTSLADLVERTSLDRGDRDALAAADALASLVGNRHQAAWALVGVETRLPLFPPAPALEATPLLRVPTEGQQIVADYNRIGFSLRRHPLALLRQRFERHGLVTAAQLAQLPADRRVRCAGLVNVRQCPQTAKGTTFMTLEDETGEINVIVWPGVAQRYRAAFLSAQLLEVRGRLQRAGDVIHLVADAMQDQTPWLGELQASARNFR